MNDRAKRRTRLGLECLESREVPATFTVTSPGDNDVFDDSGLSLRAAINRAHGAEGQSHVINFDADRLTGATITIYSQLPTLTKSIFIDGLGANSLTVARDPSSGSFRLFDITSNSASTIARLKVTGGDVAGSGGAIRNYGTLHLTDAIVSNSRASSWGGAVDSTGGALEVSGTTFSYNTAGRGGAIHIGGGSFNMTGGVVKNNTAGSEGGGIYIAASSGVSTLSGVEVKNNAAEFTGGGITSFRSLTLAGNTDIHDNFVTAAAGKGGGVYQGAGTVTYVSVRIGNNQASVGTGVYLVQGAATSAGGGVVWYGDPLNSEQTGP